MNRLILTIDGGGIRGIIAARFLDRLENLVQSEYNVSIRDAVDVYAGTSIGSAIALCYAATYMNTHKIVEVLCDRSPEIMKKDWIDSLFGIFQFRPKYNGKAKTQLLLDLLGSIGMSECHTPVVVAVFNTAKGSVEFMDEDSGLPAYVVADASTAAPAYFPPVQRSGNTYIDGGLVTNDPTLMGLSKARSMWPKDDISVLSIGTGWSQTIAKTRRNDGLLDLLRRGKGLEVLMNETDVQLVAPPFSDKYLRVNTSPKYPVSEEMDDTSPENIAGLMREGDRWFELFGGRAASMIAGNIRKK